MWGLKADRIYLARTFGWDGQEIRCVRVPADTSSVLVDDN